GYLGFEVARCLGVLHRARLLLFQQVGGTTASRREHGHGRHPSGPRPAQGSPATSAFGAGRPRRLLALLGRHLSALTTPRSASVTGHHVLARRGFGSRSVVRVVSPTGIGTSSYVLAFTFASRVLGDRVEVAIGADAMTGSHLCALNVVEPSSLQQRWNDL